MMLDPKTQGRTVIHVSLPSFGHFQWTANHSAKGSCNKSLNFKIPTKCDLNYVIPESFKGWSFAE